jgi:RNA polymerase sigma-70 factor (family 1)
MAILMGNDIDLIRQIRVSSADAFKRLFEKYQEEIFNFLTYKIGDPDIAEDIVQDVFIKLWENRYNIKECESLKPYLYTLAKNLAINYMRHQNIVIKYQQEQIRRDSQQYSSNPHIELEHKELSEKVLKEIEKLPEQQRIVFMMSRLEQMSYREIAEALNISIKTVEVHIGRALKSLVRTLKAVG